MTAEEQAAMRRYAAAGGKVILTGPVPASVCENDWQLPTRPALNAPEDFFGTIDNGVWYKAADWITKPALAPSSEPNEWKTLSDGICYNPHRIGDGTVTDAILEMVERHAKPMPIKKVQADGYLVTMFESEDAITVHLLAEEFETDIDHHLDEIRFHRSRVNLINKVEPLKVTDTLVFRSDTTPVAYTPFSEESPKTVFENGIATVHLPHNTSYVILQFPKQ
jgi:hypothetical protein